MNKSRVAMFIYVNHEIKKNGLFVYSHGLRFIALHIIILRTI